MSVTKFLPKMLWKAYTVTIHTVQGRDYLDANFYSVTCNIQPKGITLLLVTKQSKGTKDKQCHHTPPLIKKP